MKFFKNKKKFLGVLAVIMIALFFVVPIATAGDNFNREELLNSGEKTKLSNGTWAGDAARWTITLVLQFMQGVSGFVLGLGMSVVDLTLSAELYEEVFFSGNALQAINTGWSLVRDFVNMFFILILIFVAIATILRVNKFSDKKFIVYVITAALFVNFSKPITIFVIDLSNLAMSFFMSNIKDGRASYASALLNAQNMGEIFKSNTKEASTVGMLINWMVEIIFKFIMGFMLLALGLTMVVRLVAFWVLIILSPLAFFVIALPGTAIAGIKNAWLNKLTYWCFYGPIMLFFFWLALVLVSAVSVGVEGGSGELKIVGLSKDHFIVGALKIFIPYTACIYMLYYGFDISQKIAKQAGDGASWGLGKLGSIAKTAAFVGTAGYGFGYGKAAYVNVKESMQKNRAAGTLQRKANMPFGGVDKAKHQASLVDEETKKWDEKGLPPKDELERIMNTKPSMAKTFGNAAGITETKSQAEARRKAAAIKLAENGDLKVEDYGKAEAIFAKDPKNLEKFKKAAEKKSRGAMIEHEFSKNKANLVEKAVVAENKNPEREAIMEEKEEREFRAKAVEAAKQNAYNEHLDKMKLNEITDQSAVFLKTKEVQSYMRNNTGTGNEQGPEKKRFTEKIIRESIARNGLDGVRNKVITDANYFAPAETTPSGRKIILSEEENWKNKKNRD